MPDFGGIAFAAISPFDSKSVTFWPFGKAWKINARRNGPAAGFGRKLLLVVGIEQRRPLTARNAQLVAVDA
jgi:hypothetical protein